jgi:alpha-D-ribose 1-methylphosphonate 5-triphosphate diphosphatase
MRLSLRGGTGLFGRADASAEFQQADIELAGGRIACIDAVDGGDGGLIFDASNLLILPGIVDLHGDAFERQIQPRPETTFPYDIALADTDRQLVANGITTACHGLTYSWEGGLRGRSAALALLEQVVAQRAQSHCDHRIHLRFENHHLDGLADALAWIAAGKIDFLAFNEHLPSIAAKSGRPEKLAGYAERARCDGATFRERLASAQRRTAEVPQLIATLAAACRQQGVPMASHDDESHADRAGYQALGVGISEFPRTREALDCAMALGNRIVMGAPNVVLGGSHCGSLSAAETVRAGQCHILASDYYYPALLQAPFKLAYQGDCSLTEAWNLVSANPAAALGLTDRGHLSVGARADLLVVEAAAPGQVRVVATIANGKLVVCTQPERLTLRAAMPLAA